MANLNIIVKDELHRRVKAKASLLGISMQQYIFNIMEEGTKDLKEPESENEN